jgi:hypothetical protein
MGNVIERIVHNAWFAYVKNLIIGVGAGVVLVGALFKIQSWEGANQMLTIGLLTETGLFVMLGVLPPHKDYYWEQLYPGLDQHGAKVEGGGGASFDGNALTTTLDGLKSSMSHIKLDTSVLENQQKQMVGELQTMAKSMSSLKALQEADFSQMKDFSKSSNDFVKKLNAVVSSIEGSLKDTEEYTKEMATMSKNLKNINGVYNGVFESVNALSQTADDTKAYAQNISSVNQNLQKLNSVYGNVLAAMGQK